MIQGPMFLIQGLKGVNQLLKMSIQQLKRLNQVLKNPIQATEIAAEFVSLDLKIYNNIKRLQNSLDFSFRLEILLARRRAQIAHPCCFGLAFAALIAML